MEEPDKTRSVPHSSGRNRFATKRTLALLAIVVVFLLVAVMVPW
jgi:hypothetical protein